MTKKPDPMLRVLRYELTPPDLAAASPDICVTMPHGARCLSLQNEDGAAMLYVLADPDEFEVTRAFRMVVPLGSLPHPFTAWSFIGSAVFKDHPSWPAVPVHLFEFVQP